MFDGECIFQAVNYISNTPILTVIKDSLYLIDYESCRNVRLNVNIVYLILPINKWFRIVLCYTIVPHAYMFFIMMHIKGQILYPIVYN